MAVAYDAEGLASDFGAALGGLGPATGVHLLVPVTEAAGEADNLGDHELRHRAAVAEGRVPHGDTRGTGGLKVDLVGTNTKTANTDEFLSFF